jgi:hypothetical protein
MSHIMGSSILEHFSLPKPFLGTPETWFTGSESVEGCGMPRNPYIFAVNAWKENNDASQVTVCSLCVIETNTTGCTDLLQGIIGVWARYGPRARKTGRSTVWDPPRLNSSCRCGRPASSSTRFHFQARGRGRCFFASILPAATATFRFGDGPIISPEPLSSFLSCPLSSFLVSASGLGCKSLRSDLPLRPWTSKSFQSKYCTSMYSPRAGPRIIG